MHTEVEFPIQMKVGNGKGAARKTRAAGFVPGVVYGYNFEPKMVSFEERVLVKALKQAGRNTFLRFACEDTDLNGTRAMIKDLQVHPLHRRFLHADFFMLDPERAINADVPIVLKGTAIGVKLGGVMSVARHEIAVTCKPDDLPTSIVIDVSAMKPGESIHVRDIEAPEGVTFLLGGNLTICAVVAASSGDEEEGEEGEEETEEAGTEEE